MLLIHVELASALRLTSTWPTWGNSGGSGCLMRGAMGQRGNSAAKNSRVSQYWDSANEWSVVISLSDIVRPNILYLQFLNYRLTKTKIY